MGSVSQLAFFEDAGCAVVDDAKPTLADTLDGFAFLYTATAKGNNSGIRFAMRKEDAMAWCDSPVSRGVLHGTEWAYFWTSAKNFIECHWGLHKPRLDIRRLTDNGQWDERIAALGLRKISFPEFRSVFGPLGVEVLA